MKYSHGIPGCAFVLLLLMIAGACEKQPTDYRSFLNEQEIIYPAAAANIETGPGKNRVLLKWKRNPDPSITKYIIYWNNNNDSTIVEATSGTASDTIRTYIGNLDEGAYSFTVYSFDQEENRSIPVLVENIKVYGDKYEVNLLNRSVASTNYADGKLILTWNEPDTINVHTEIKYTSLAGQVKTLFLSPDSSKLAISDWKLPTSIVYRSAYKPEKDAIDTFRAPRYDTLAVSELPVSKSSWKQVLLTNDADVNAFGASLANIWDGEPGAFPDIYHSDGATMPHTFTIDLGVTYQRLSRFMEWGRTDFSDHNPVEFEIWGIADITDAVPALPPTNDGWKEECIAKGWTLLADVKRTDDGTAGIEYDLAQPAPPVRFIRIRVLRSAGNTTYSHMSELSFWYNP